LRYAATRIAPTVKPKVIRVTHIASLSGLFVTVVLLVGEVTGYADQ
jgi:hypothetical protein